MNKNELHNLLDAYIDSCEHSEEMSNLLNNCMQEIIPEILVKRKNKIANEKGLKSEFIERFLYVNRYYYCSISELFILYNGVNYIIYSEDDIRHQIVTTITSQQKLLECKEEINNKIIELIRNRSPLVSIPESATIQNTLDELCPKFFQNRNWAKYFLTIVGDILLKKTNSQIFIINGNIKKLIDEIIYHSSVYFGNISTFQNIKYKYHGYNYNLCRLIKTIKNNKIIDISSGFSRNMLNLLCVATHYSKRYSNSDLFLQQCCENEVSKHALYLQENNIDLIIDDFVNKTFQFKKDSSITKKNMLYLWKLFLKERDIPNIVLNDVLKIKLKNKLSFNSYTDEYDNITSSQLPAISKFIDFWNETIEKGSDEFEISEITHLFKDWMKCKNKSFQFSDEMILDLINHFYPDTTIYNNKYIVNISSTLWNKIKIVKESIIKFDNKFLKENSNHINDLLIGNSVNMIISEEDNVKFLSYSLYQVYEYYCSTTKNQPIMSKKYFEEKARKILGNLIDKDDIMLVTRK